MQLTLGMHLSLWCEYSMQVADGDDNVDGDKKYSLHYDCDYDDGNGDDDDDDDGDGTD